MDYDQDYSKLNATDNQWYDFKDRESTVSADPAASSAQTSQRSRPAELTADMLDNEDFD